MEVLHRVKSGRRLVVLTIHQPRAEMFNMFDKIIFLAEGQVSQILKCYYFFERVKRPFRNHPHHNSTSLVRPLRMIFKYRWPCIHRIFLRQFNFVFSIFELKVQNFTVYNKPHTHTSQCMLPRPRCTKIYSVQKSVNARVQLFFRRMKISANTAYRDCAMNLNVLPQSFNVHESTLKCQTVLSDQCFLAVSCVVMAFFTDFAYSGLWN